MEWKEHIAWIAPYLATVVAFGAVYYGRRLAYEPAVRRLLIWVFVAGFVIAGIAGLFGALITRRPQSSRDHRLRKRRTIMVVNTERVDIAVTERDVLVGDEVAVAKPDGPLAAALLAAGIGSFALGLFTTLAEASTAFRERLILDAGVGPLSGKTVWATVVFIIAWAVLAARLRNRDGLLARPPPSSWC